MVITCVLILLVWNHLFSFAFLSNMALVVSTEIVFTVYNIYPFFFAFFVNLMSMVRAYFMIIIVHTFWAMRIWPKSRSKMTEMEGHHWTPPHPHRPARSTNLGPIRIHHVISISQIFDFCIIFLYLWVRLIVGVSGGIGLGKNKQSPFVRGRSPSLIAHQRWSPD